MNLKWYGHIAKGTGYGTASREYCESLMELGVNLEIYSFSGLYPSEWMKNTHKKDSRAPLLVHDVPRIPADAYYTVFEFDQAPQEWANILNKCRVIFTPSVYSRESLRTITDTPIEIVHHGVGKEFGPIGPKLKLEDVMGRELPSYKFLYVFEWVKRKRPYDLIKAFKQAFTPEDDACLILKTHHSHKPIRYLIGKETGDANIYLLNEFVDDLSPLYRSVDCYVSSSACEGWGEPLSEAMATGLPTIAGFRNGGHMEFMTPQNSYLINCLEEEAIGYNDMEHLIKPWFKYNPLNINFLATTMKHIYDDQETAKICGRKGREDIKKFTWKAAAEKMKGYLEEYFNG